MMFHHLIARRETLRQTRIWDKDISAGNVAKADIGMSPLSDKTVIFQGVSHTCAQNLAGLSQS
ncbi:hypothetical protein BKP64_08110 [Marinobacter salinus]|uniref:Uncharacterized protein n=1 Tax=Marinobacter salinus TaxID=1874317 RepID=A0A1D9GKG1_9GAMM|nr:hypothetical protein BKP64_08110 [Marinobacter salinus]